MKEKAVEKSFQFYSRSTRKDQPRGRSLSLAPLLSILQQIDEGYFIIARCSCDQLSLSILQQIDFISSHISSISLSVNFQFYSRSTFRRCWCWWWSLRWLSILQQIDLLQPLILSSLWFHFQFYSRSTMDLPKDQGCCDYDYSFNSIVDRLRLLRLLVML